MARDSQPPDWAFHLASGKDFKLLEEAVPARALDGHALERETARIYQALLARAADRHVVRIWNFVPAILADGGDGLNRYMRFNAGRHRAFTRHFGGTAQFDRLLPAASGVGHAGNDLMVFALLSQRAGTSIANPRQRAPHRYSREFGPLPPCFARATLVGDLLLIGGTASVRDEHTVHHGDLNNQLRETFENLAALVHTAFPGENPADCFQALRVYHPRQSDRTIIQSAVRAQFARASQIDFVQADLCRDDLLVEIEGIAASRCTASRFTPHR